MSNNDTTGARTLEDKRSVEVLCELFSCYICMERLRDAHLCPRCSKLCCLECISKWLGKSDCCPNCRAKSRLNKFVKCVWAKEITEQLLLLERRSDRSTRAEEERANSSRQHLTPEPRTQVAANRATNTAKGSGASSGDARGSTWDVLARHARERQQATQARDARLAAREARLREARSMRN